jgi:hypothetical protein
VAYVDAGVSGEPGGTRPGAKPRRYDREALLQALVRDRVVRFSACQTAARNRRFAPWRDWSAPLASQNANLEPLVEGPAISLPGLHVKVRREEYRQ